LFLTQLNFVVCGFKVLRCRVYVWVINLYVSSVMVDIKNLEHVVRKMPGQIDRSPWS
jgi:hypothetical protein